jgi:hypothetical protein
VSENKQCQKEIVVHSEGLFKKSQNYFSTGDRTAELNIHLEDPVSTKNV